MKKIIAAFCAGMLLAVTACEENEVEHPSIETLSVNAVSASDFVVIGKVLKTGTIPILDYGIVYSTSNISHNLSVDGGTRVSLGKAASVGEFETTFNYELSSGYYQNTKLYARVYLTNEKGTVYGSVKEVALPVLSVTSVSATSGRVGDEVRITGKNFSPDMTKNIVKFNEVVATITSVSSTLLVVTVPSGITSQYSSTYSDIDIRISVGGQTVAATESFKLLPSVSDFSPKSGGFNTLVTISGFYFSSSSTSVRVGGVTVSSSYISTSALSFRIPYTITAETLTIEVIVDGKSIAVPGVFTVLPTQLTSITPFTGGVGTLVEINGNYFDANPSGNIVKFGNVSVSVNNATTTQLKVYVPTSLDVGSYPVTVKTGIFQVNSPNEFSVGAPEITSFSSSSGLVSTYMTINGKNFGDVSGSVLFGSTSASIYSWKNTAVTVVIPFFSTAQSVKITVSVGGKSVTSVDNFSVTK